MISLDRLGVRTVFASRRGVPLDGNFDTGAGTNAAPYLQPLLDLAQAGPLHLVIDGVAQVGAPLRVRSNTRIESATDRCGLVAAPGLNGPLLRNANWVSGYNGGNPVYDGSTIVDRGISIIGGRFECSRGDGTTGNCTGGDPRKAGATGSGIIAGQYVGGVMLFGVRGLTVRDLTITNPPAFGLWLANCFGARIDHFASLDPGYGIVPPPARNTDGLHVNGPAADIVATNLTIDAADDSIALNADDGHLPGSGDVGEIGFGTYASVWKGPINRVLVDGVRSRGMSALRILSASSRIDAVTVRNVTGSAYYHAAICDQFGALPGGGNVGRLTLENWQFDQSANADGSMRFGGVFDQVTLRNINRTLAPGAGGWEVFVQGTVRDLDIDGLNVIESSPYQSGPLVVLGAANGTTAIGSARVRGSWQRPGQSSASPHPFVSVVGDNTAIGSLRLELAAERCTNLLRHSGNALPAVIAVGCSYRNGSGPGIATTGGITNLATSGCIGLLNPSGTITNSGVNL